MKPLKLTMTAFGPYKHQEVIDFSELKGNRLFVVSGNTGAGKTSIFDAISFALYGEASGEDRNDSRMLRSHFADDDVHTSVDFEFELKGRVYRVFRQLAHVKAGNKGETGGRCELYGIVDGEETPLTDRFIVTQVDEKLREIIGLTKEQFSQIVMLPQGEFRKLLTSETENKEEILRRIFKTGLYKIVADRLNEKRRQAQRSSEELAGIRDYHISNVKETLAGREGSGLQQVFQQQHYNTHQVLAALDTETAFHAGQIKQLKDSLQAETAKYQQHTAVFHQARRVNEQFDLLDQKAAVRQQLEDQGAEFQRKAQQLLLAEQAAHLRLYERHDAEMTDELTGKSRLLDAALAECAQAEAALQAAARQYAQEEAKAEQREQAVRELARLKGFEPIVREMDRKQKGVVALEAEAGALIRQLQAVEAELDAGQKERASTSAQVKELEGRTAHLSERMEKLNLLREQAVLVKEYFGLLEKAEGEQQAEIRLGEAFAKAESSYLQLESRWMEGQAGILASYLHDGDPCPVCGGVDHPKKAAVTGDIPSKEELERMRQDKTQAERNYLGAKAAFAATAQQIQEKRSQVLEHGFDLGKIQAEFDGLVEAGKALAEEVKGLKADQAKLTELKQSLEKLDGRLDEVRERKEELSGRFNEKKTAHATEKALYEQAIAAIPEELRNLRQLEAGILAAEARKQQLEEEWKQAQQRYQAGNERYVKAAAGRDHAEAQMREAQAKKLKAHEAFVEALRKAGFEADEAYHAAKLAETERTALKLQIDDYHASLAAVCRQIEELSAALADQQRQDLAELQRQLQELEQRIEDVRSLLVQAQNSCDKASESKAKIIEAEEKWTAAERQFQLVKDLYDVVRGENSRKTSFERYLQIEFLEKIVHAANQRLQRISNGQFYLVRSGRLEKRGRQSGLGLDVYDNYTGQLRDVKTLSGGEKFNASLCLALGMADVIQSYEGGISMETMFIDEGFGSLDEESLNKAIDTLIDLQQSGRMIGVISHVQELKQAIPAILEVKKTKEGYSYTRFNVS
ncbi:AAA family ATPase [Ferviditalea candida]|uniref:Nuclease SbcCD subunit C n=1 Tax=Ferviditalea candida TaxID=3108399 RepID=A0ABU5ZH46_9BACL|nr:SMC family ATPase [Paenibacillaceae bacterium T2]